MDIKIITCHNVANYGAALQALALQTYIEEKGHDVKIICTRVFKFLQSVECPQILPTI